MPFQVRAQLDPTQAATNWSTGVQAGGAKLAKGYASPRRDPQAAAKAASPRWLAAVTAAQPAFEAGVTGYSADAAIASMQANGVQRYTSSATTKKANYSKVAAQLLPAIAAAAAALPADRSTPAARDARATAMAAAMRNLRGKFRKGNVA